MRILYANGLGLQLTGRVQDQAHATQPVSHYTLRHIHSFVHSLMLLSGSRPFGIRARGDILRGPPGRLGGEKSADDQPGANLLISTTGLLSNVCLLPL